ncbi:hypothetical protein Ciccas_004836 [Cichlidogyrus casuarinus]|uniref:Uncharacterized protein n=1 Tax=Cichlidogyrus casuarinus TaxID=1844966 RepID=A0ABD2QAF4_9PLAT
MKAKDIISKQQKIAQNRTALKANIKEKQEKRQQARKDRNLAYCKKTKSGQPSMKHRIKYMISEMTKNHQ